jgi:hypothetical protein
MVGFPFHPLGNLSVPSYTVVGEGIEDSRVQEFK